MKFRFFIFFILVIFLGAFISGCTIYLGGEVKIKDLLNPDNKNTYDGKQVTVTGTVTKVGEGCMYKDSTTNSWKGWYSIADDTGEIRIVPLGGCQPQFYLSDHVRIVGQFHQFSGGGSSCMPGQLVPRCYSYPGLGPIIYEENRTILQ